MMLSASLILLKGRSRASLKGSLTHQLNLDIYVSLAFQPDAYQMQGMEQKTTQCKGQKYDGFLRFDINATHLKVILIKLLC